MTDSLWRSSEQLTNEGFRRLLSEPKSAASARRKKPSNKDKDSKGKGKHKPKPGDEQDDEKEQYRDRAKERREQGYDKDYADVIQELTAQGISDVARLARLEADQTKYLGGDISRTHLVKGLDYALLEKQKVKIQHDDSATEPAPKQAEQKEDAKKVDFQTTVGRGVYNALFNPKRSNVAELFQPRRMAFRFGPDEDGIEQDVPITVLRAEKVKTQEQIMAAVDRQILEHMSKLLAYIKVDGGKKIKKKDKQKMLEEYGIVDTAKPQAAAASQHVNGVHTQANHAARQSADDDDEDIFDDAGRDYKPTVVQKPKKLAAAAAGSYFDSKDDLSDLPPIAAPMNGSAAAAQQGDSGDVGVPPPPPPPQQYAADAQPDGYSGYYDVSQQQWMYMDAASREAYIQANVAYQAQNDPEYQQLLARQHALRMGGADEHGAAAAQVRGEGDLTQEEKAAGLASVFRRDAEATKPRKSAINFGTDAYEECFPSTFGFGNEAYESDEDLDKMDRKGGGMTRADFNTEEEWSEYKQSREAMPKAAFQFGVKMTDGRKSHKDLDEKRTTNRREQKLSTQLHKIERLLKDQGHGHDTAFRVPQPAAVDTSDATPATSKRRRMI